MAEHYGFSFCCTIMAASTFILAVGSCVFFMGRDCINSRTRNYRYSFLVDSDTGCDCAKKCDDLTAQPILHLARSPRLTTREGKMKENQVG